MHPTPQKIESNGRARLSAWRERNPRWAANGVRLAAAVAVVLALAWWFLLSPIPVGSHRVGTGSIRAEVMGTGTLEARISAIVGSKIGGLITLIDVDQGDRVATGDLLFQLEDSDIRQQVAIAESEVAAANATLERLAASRKKAEAVMNQARSSFERIEQLSRRNVASEADLDRALEALSVAEAELSLSLAAIVEGRKRLDAAERSRAYQRARLDDTTIEAPFDALVVRRSREAGDVVTAGSSVLQVASTREMWISAWVDETELIRLADGQPARIVFRSNPAVAHPGVVARIGRETDRETREILVDVHIDELPRRWAIGQRAEVFIEVDRREAVTILPAELILNRQGRTGVIVDVDRRARWREIELGLRGREGFEVLSGLSPGDVVVGPVDPDAELPREGRRIRLE